MGHLASKERQQELTGEASDHSAAQGLTDKGESRTAWQDLVEHKTGWVWTVDMSASRPYKLMSLTCSDAQQMPVHAC